MTRLFALTYGAAAFAAGMMLVHCSSSSSPGGTVNTDGGKADAPHTTTGPGSGSSTDSGTTTPHDATPGSGSGSDSGTVMAKDSGTSADTGTVTNKDSGLTDTYDAGPCVGPAGGEACDPGNVECGTSQCAVPGHECCLGSGSSASCLGVTATCAGDKQACDEKSDCPDGQICCLDVTDFSGDFTISCQTGATCPAGTVAGAQICKTNAECSTGTCSLWSCQGQITEACQAPSPIDCTMM